MTPTTLEIALALALPTEAAARLARIDGPGWECWTGRGARCHALSIPPANRDGISWFPADPTAILDAAADVAGASYYALTRDHLGWTAWVRDVRATGYSARAATLAVYAAVWREREAAE